jgi:WD40 repeat protein/Mrp family chromosome partitioning ATPase
MRPAAKATAGQVITFYSYKGGTGRTMALANVGVLLATLTNGGRPTLMIDWDLEAPGLHKYFPRRGKPDGVMEDPTRPGLVELFTELAEASVRWQSLDETARKAEVIRAVNEIDLQRFITPTDVPNLDLLKAGAFSDDYSDLVNRFHWDEFYARSPWAFRALTERLIAEYAYVIVDSRTGLSDTSGICTTLLPEKLVVVFTPNAQSLQGVKKLVDSAIEHRYESNDLRPLVVYPLPSRIEFKDPEQRNAWRHGGEESNGLGWQRFFEETLSAAYEIEGCGLNEYFDQVQIQHIPYYAYGEKIAVRIDRGTEIDSAPMIYQRFVGWLVDRSTPWETEAQATARKEQERADVAEEIYAALETDEQRAVAKRLFTRLVKIRSDREVGDYTLCIIDRDDVRAAGESEAARHDIDTVVARFLEAGYLTRVTHSPSSHAPPTTGLQLKEVALLRSWHRLVEWIAKDREFLVWRQNLDAQLTRWTEHRRDRSLLLRGKELEEASRWWKEQQAELNAAEEEFLSTSFAKSMDAPVAEVSEALGLDRGVAAYSPAMAPSAPPPPLARFEQPMPEHAPARPAARSSRVPLVIAAVALVAVAVAALGYGSYSRFGHDDGHADLVVVASAGLESDPAKAALLLASLDERDGASALSSARALSRVRLPSAVYPAPGMVSSVAVSPKGSFILFITESRDAYLRSVEPTEGRFLQLPVSQVTRGTFSSDGRSVLLLGREGTIYILSDDRVGESPLWTPGRMVDSVAIGSRTVGASLTTDGRLVSIDQRGAFSVWEQAPYGGWKGTALPSRSKEMVKSAVFSADGSVAVLDAGAAMTQLWLTRPSPRLSTQYKILAPNAMALSYDGSYAAFLGSDSVTRVFDAMGRDVWSRRSQFATGIALDRRGHRIAIAGAGGRTVVLPIRTNPGMPAGSDSAELRSPSAVRALAFGPDDRTLVTASDSSIRVWPLDWTAPADTSWPALRQYFETNVSACLNPSDRATILRENQSMAQQAFDECAKRNTMRPTAVVPRAVAAPREPDAPTTRKAPAVRKAPSAY